VDQQVQVVRGICLPGADNQVGPQILDGPTVAGAGTFQWRKFAAAVPLIHDFRHALDVGAHVGTWSRVMARLFAKVSAFEPLELHRDCFYRNVPEDQGCEVKLYDCALGENVGVVNMSIKEGKSSTSHVDPNGAEVVRVCPLDSFHLTEVDFIKCDTEGFEAAVIRGGEATIKKWRPTVIVEQKPNNAERQGYTQFQAAELLQSWGALIEWNIGNDLCLRWKKR
jgi:FkbM family methyltransferase